MPLAHSPEHIDRVIRACGAGRVLHVAPAISDTVGAYRQRAIDATGCVTSGLSSHTPLRLPFANRAFDLVSTEGVLDQLEGTCRAQAFSELMRVSRRNVLVHAANGESRQQWEARCLEQAVRKHPLHQVVMPYDGLDWEQAPFPLLFERLPEKLALGTGLSALASARDLHMDMLREAGRRADAHVARYMFARQFIRPADRVLDAACGLGYGSAILAEGTLAESVVGMDLDAWAIDYAADHYGRGRSRVRFEHRDLATLHELPAASVDAIVSFETVEHVADPDAFLAACRRALTPAGRLICSVPNLWVNEHGVDPNPHHLHVFDRAKLEGTCRRHFFIERVFGQTAGGGMKLPEAGRALWPADAKADDAEWWLLVGMKDPSADATTPWRVAPEARDDRTNVLAVARDYDNPWLVRAMVSIGLRSESPKLLEGLVSHTSATAGLGTADEGAALCVGVYQRLTRGLEVPGATIERINKYCATTTRVPHVRRWQISLQYAVALHWLRQGATNRASGALETCALSDALDFSPLLATKTVGAAFLRGWIGLQAGDLDAARRWWTTGVESAERAIRQPWDGILLNRETPAVFGLREATEVMDLASQCATGLHLLPHALDRPGAVASQLFESMAASAKRHEQHARALAAELSAVRQHLAQATAVNDDLVAAQRASLLLRRTSLQFPANLRVAVFGAGAGGQLAMAALKDRGARIVCVADNDTERRTGPMNGLAVVDPSTLTSYGVDMIAVAVASATGRQAIFAQLESLGYEYGRDFDKFGH